MKKVWMLVVVAGFVAGLASSAKADDIAELRKLMEQQYEQMRQMQNRLIALEQAQNEQGQTIQKIEKTGMSIPESLAWIEKVSFYGDFRYRYEYIDAEGSSSDRHRNRIRARIGLKGKVNDEMSVNVRLASGSSDPASTNQTLDGGFSSKDLWLDRAYLKWEPAGMAGWAFLFGKMGNPFYKPGKSQLIWDDDVNPEGVAAQYTGDLGEGLGLFVNAGGMWVEENSSDADASLWGIQGGLEHDLNGSNLTWGAGYFKYGNIKNSKTFFDSEDGFGNSTYIITNSDGVDETYYMHDYELFEAFAAYDTSLGDTPLSVYGDYVVNTASGVSDDTGWLIGAKYSKAKAPGSWQLGYEYRDLEKDAVVGVFTDSDFVGGGTDGKGHKFSVAYALAKNTTLNGTYFMTQRDSNGDGSRSEDYDRVQVDVKVKF